MKTSTKLALISSVALGMSAWTCTAHDAGGRPADGQRLPRRQGGPQQGPGRDGQRPPPPAIIAALDANGDGVIDADEIANASAAMAKLDKNGDGKLTPDEFIGQRPGPGGPGGFGGPGGPGGPHGPPPKEILEKYDVNKDGKLDESEHAAVRKDIEDGKLQPPPHPRGPGGGPPPPDAPPQQ